MNRKNLRANVETKDMVVRPKMKVRRSFRRGAEPQKEDRIWKSVAHFGGELNR